MKMQVFISSTFEDMKAERQTAVQAILEAGHIPAGMELEVAEARWLPLDDAPRLLSYGGEREMAIKAAATL